MRWLPFSKPLKFNISDCGSPSTVSLMFCTFPYIWQLVSHLLMLFPQESYSLSFKVMKICECIHEKFPAYEWSWFDGYGYIKLRHFYVYRAVQSRTSHIIDILLPLWWNGTHIKQCVLQTQHDTDSRNSYWHPLLNWLTSSKTFKDVIRATNWKFS